MSKMATWVQGRPSRMRRPFSFKSLTMLEEREVLHQQLHHEHQRPALHGIDLEAPAIVGNAQAIGDILAEARLG